MKGPGFSLNLVKDPRRKQWMVNSDPAKLDAFYDAFLGQGGSRMLSEETKWLAVTHKSFDYGRRGYNTRLAFLGTFWQWSQSQEEISGERGKGMNNTDHG